MLWGKVIAAGGSQYDHNMNAMPLQRSRGDWTSLELFVAGVRGWEADLRRQMDEGKANSD